jgi:hypothetical protein
MIWRGSSGSEDGPDQEQGYEDANPQTEPGGVGSRIESVLDAAERAAVGIREDAQEWARRYLDESRRKADDAAAQRIQEISSLTDSLVSRAKAVAAQSDELIAALDDAGRRMLNNAKPGSQVSPPPPGNDQRPAPPQQAPAAQPPPAAPVPPTQAERPPPARVTAAPPPPVPPPQRTAPPPAQPPRAAPPVREVPPPSTEPQSPPPAPPEQPAPEQQPAAADAPRVSEGARLLATQMAVAGSSRDEIAWRLREEFGIQDASAILDEIGI